MEPALELSDSLRARAHALVYGTGTPWVVPPARDAATVVLLRDGDEGLEVFLMRRPMTMAFAPGMYVFPGGAVDEADEAETLFVTGAFGSSLVAAAVRETYEECGVQLEATSLVPWTHWVTPEIESRRFDTRFFAAKIPPGQRAQSLTDESNHSAWVTPVAGLTEHSRGRMPMLPPTSATLRDLVDFVRADDALLAAARREIRPLMPRPFAAGSREVVWRLCDASDGSVIDPNHGEPSGSEVRGLGDTP